MDDIEIRQATPQDKEAVLGIRDDVYGGRDYLAAFYDNFMSSPNTTSFVVVYNGNIVSMIIFLFCKLTLSCVCLKSSETIL